MDPIPVKIECGCGQHYAFDVVPVDGGMPSPVACPACGASGTEAANEAIQAHLAQMDTTGAGASSYPSAIAVAILTVLLLGVGFIGWQRSRPKSGTAKPARTEQLEKATNNVVEKTEPEEPSAVAAASTGLGPDGPAIPLAVTNFVQGETVRYPLIEVEGTAGGTNLAIQGGVESCHQVFNGRFRAFVELKTGANTIEFRDARGASTKLLVNYVPSTSAYRVRTIFAFAIDHPVHGDPALTEAWRQGVATSVKLLQCVSAEAMRKAGRGRKTFSLEFTPNGEVDVYKYVVPQPAAAVDRQERNANCDFWVQSLKRDPLWVPDGTRNYLLFNDCVHGWATPGNLSVTGIPDIGCFPRRTRDIIAVFGNHEKAEKYKDGKGPSVSGWLGVSLHEAGHAFGLWHPGPHFWIMQNDDGFYNQILLATEKEGALKELNGPLPTWGTQSALLAYSLWFQPDAKVQERTGPKITFGGNDVVFESPAGVAVICFSGENGKGGVNDYYEEFGLQGPTRVVRTLQVIHSKVGPGKFTAHLMDRLGRKLDRQPPQIKPKPKN